MELVCPAGSLPALRAAVDNGADAVYIGFQNQTNARNFPGLNFSVRDAARGVEYARQHKRRVFVAINTFPPPAAWDAATRAVEDAVGIGADALILADIGLLDYASRTHPGARLHLSVQGSATNRHAIAFYHREFGIARAILPRVLSLSQVRRLVASVPVEVEVFAFGSLCVMVEGRCALSSYVTGDSPNTTGVCSPARAVRWIETPAARESYLADVLVDRFREGEAAGYPTICKGRFEVNDRIFHAIEEPTSLNVLGILPALMKCGVAAIKVEGRQRSRAYVAEVARTLREALDACMADPDYFRPAPRWIDRLNALSEGSCHTLGAYYRPWQ
ncbi:MAG: U32 family peptidase [Gammaproteobacteria bacterium]|nr:U32 family peptidase [Gammaproteobacteria bacterium]